MSNLRNQIFVSSFSQNAISVIKDYGVGMEINHTCISEVLDKEDTKRSQLLANIKKDIEESEATNLVLHGPFTEIIPAGIDYHMREAALERLEEAYRVCESFGIKKMIVHNGWIPFMYFKEWQASEAPKFWEKFMANKPMDFTIAIENVLEDEPYMIADMMKNIRDPRIRVCLDTGHANAMTSEEYDIYDWIRVLSPYISHLHLHNNDGTKDSHGNFEDGTMDMEAVFDCFEQYLGDEVTYTVEAGDAESCLAWLLERRYI